jgi:hypothetical protein
MVLHELAHLIRDPGTGEWLIPNDGKDPSKSEKNTKTIEKACGDQIKALK